MSLTSNGLFHGQNRFGIHKDVLLAYSPDYKDRTKVDCYVPSRTEVFGMAIAELRPILEVWFTQAPEALTPSAAQKAEVLKLLRLRMDKNAIQADITALEQL